MNEQLPVPAEEAEADPAAKPKERSKGGLLPTIIAVLVVTLVAGGAGGGIGIYLADAIERTVEEKAKADGGEEPQLRYSGDVVLHPLDPVLTNLADPGDVWIRLETSIVFENGALENPAVTAAEIRQDILAYARTIPLSQLEGPSALQHLREDLNERVAIRTSGKVGELVIETMVVQ